MTSKQHIDLRLLTFLKEFHALMDRHDVDLEPCESGLCFNYGPAIYNDDERMFSVIGDSVIDANSIKRLLANCEEWTEDSP